MKNIYWPIQNCSCSGVAETKINVSRGGWQMGREAWKNTPVWYETLEGDRYQDRETADTRWILNFLCSRRTTFTHWTHWVLAKIFTVADNVNDIWLLWLKIQPIINQPFMREIIILFEHSGDNNRILPVPRMVWWQLGFVVSLYRISRVFLRLSDNNSG